jgi:hypothetical protein
MRRSIMVSSVVSLLLAGSRVPAMAQDGADPGYQRVEVPEAAVALALPADWAVDIELDEREDFYLSELFPEAAPVTYWNVLYASGSGRPWCDVTWYPAHPMTLEEHALLFEQLMTPSTNVERTIEVVPAELPAGAAYRFVIYNQPTDDYQTVYLIGSGPSRYALWCVADERVEGDWLAIAQTLEPSTADPIESPEPSPRPSLEPDQ